MASVPEITEDGQEPSFADAAEGSQDEQQPEELSDDLIAELRTLIKKFSLEEMPNRRQELLKAREGRFFWEGYHYPMYSADNGVWAVPESGGFPWMSGQDERSKRFYYVHNIYTPLGKTLISTLAGTPPPVRFMPCNPLEISDIESAKEAEKYRKLFYRAVDISQFLRDLARYAYTDGRTVGWVKKVTDGKRFGFNADGTEKTQEVAELYGVLETKVPISLRDQSEFPYLQISYERHISAAKDEFSDKADKIKSHESAPGEDRFDRICRLAVLQGTEQATSTGESYNHLVTEQHTWIRPSAFRMIANETKRAALAGRFKRGIHVIYVGETFVKATEENMDETVVTFQPMSGDGQAIPALGRFLIPIQKRLNNLENLLQEKYEKGTPIKFVDSKLIDSEGLTDAVASPEQYVEVKKPAGEPLENFFFKEPEPTASNDMMAMINNLKGTDAQMVSGAQPALFGGSMTNAKAAAIYAQARDQALGSLAITYAPMKTFLAKINELAAWSAETREAQTISGLVPDERGTFQNVSLDLDKLRQGFYKCEPEVDEGLPESPSAQRQAFMSMVQFMPDNPMFQQLMQQPDNQYLLKTLTGIKGFTVPGADQRNVQLKEIEQLLEGEPTLPTPEEIQKVAQHQTILEASGAPSPQPKPEDLVRPSIEIDTECDDHPVHWAEVQRWMYSEEGQQAKLINPAGFENVRLHGLLHKRSIQAGPDAGVPMQDNVPNPQKAIQGMRTKAALMAHSASGQPPMGPPAAPPKLQNSAAKARPQNA